SVTNNVGANTSWYWEQSFAGNNYSLQSGVGSNPVDMDFCLNLALGSAAPCAPAPVGNDECSTAQTISGTGTFPFDNTTSTNSSHRGCGGIGRDVWLSWTAPADGQVDLTLCGGTSMDTVAQAFDACGGNSLACDDDSSCGLQSEIQFVVTNGHTYKLRIGS